MSYGSRENWFTDRQTDRHGDNISVFFPMRKKALKKLECFHKRAEKMPSLSYSTLRRKVRAQLVLDIETSNPGQSVELLNLSSCKPQHSTYLPEENSETLEAQMSFNNENIILDSDMEMEGCDINNSNDFDPSSICYDFDNDTDTETDIEIDTDFPNEIRQWVLQYNIAHNAVSDLLKILQPHHPSLPRDARTLMQTPRQCPVKNLKCGGQYTHVGLEFGLVTVLKENIIDSNCLELQFNIDGLPIFKSSALSLWPI